MKERAAMHAASYPPVRVRRWSRSGDAPPVRPLRPPPSPPGTAAIPFFALLLLACFAVVLGRLHQLQADAHPVHAAAVARLMQGRETVPGKRGAIVDARGRPLALSVAARSCAIDPRAIVDDGTVAVEDVVERLADLLELPVDQYRRIRREAEKTNAVRVDDDTVEHRPRRFVWVQRPLSDTQTTRLERALADARAEADAHLAAARRKRREASQTVDAREAQALRDEARALDEQAREARARFAGVLLPDDAVRVYPQGRVASHLLGFTDIDGRGLEGMERFGDALMASPPVRRSFARDAARRRLAADADGRRDGEVGHAVMMSVDAAMQLIAEEELAKGIAALGPNPALSGSAIVMDPFTGDVLAMASWPDFDPNAPAEHAARHRRNDAIATVQEPGSVIKPFVYARALQRGRLRLDEMIDCSTYRMPGRSRPITDVGGSKGVMTAEAALYKSSNIGAVKVGERLGLRELHDLLRELGFGERTSSAPVAGADGAAGVPATFPGELKGRVYPFEKWGTYSLGSVPQGYEFSVTPLQMTVAYCAIANGGALPEPRVVRAVLSPDGDTALSVPVRMRRRVFDEATTRQIRQAMRKVVTEGTARHYANDKTYAIAGKTGTANLTATAEEKAQGLAETNGYSKKRHTGNFAGFAPYAAPRLVVSVSIRETTKYGGEAAGPVGAAILRRCLEYLRVPPSTPEAADRPAPSRAAR